MIFFSIVISLPAVDHILQHYYCFESSSIATGNTCFNVSIGLSESL